MEEGISAVAELVGNIVALLLISAAVLALTKRIRFPFTVALVLAGIGIGLVAEHGGPALRPLAELEISPDVILFVFLPTLIFESAFHLDARQLRHNLPAILTLAVPGLVLSTTLIGVLLWLLTPFDFATALLLGAILSATDPVAVIALFKQLGTPVRLTILVEGESLFNDATSIVVARILVGVVAAGYFSAETAVAGSVDFFVVFLGGILVGWLAALIVGWVLGHVEGDPFIEISLTTILAYLSFLIAEEVFHVSGVMATVAAGVTLGAWGRAKISPSVASYMEHFWGYLAFVANALIFLLVGLRVELGALYGSLDVLGWVILAMLISRAMVVYGLVPLVGRLPNSEPISRSYQTVMVWGGLRGAIALAIALGLEGTPDAETIIALVMGAVLFSLLVPGLTIEALVRRLGLDKPPLAERVSRIEGLLSAKHHALKRILELQNGGLFSARIASRLQQKGEREIKDLRAALDHMRGGELDREQERQLLFNRGLATERSCYYELFGKGHISEPAYRDLCHSVDLQAEALRHTLRLPPYTLHPPTKNPLRRLPKHWFGAVFGFTGLPELLRSKRIARDYEEAWGHYQGSARVIADLDELAHSESVPSDIIDEIRDHYRYWSETARDRIDSTTEQFPEFAAAMQERLAGRLSVHAEGEIIEKESLAGTIPAGVAEVMLKDLAKEVRVLRGSDVAHLRIAPSELLRKVPFFRDTPAQEFALAVGKLVPLTVRAGEVIIKQGKRGESLYLIGRGVVRVSHAVDGRERDIATLMAGDFFGEMALLHHELRTATCRAVTPCALYEMRRKDFDEVRAACPAIQQALEEADRKRAEELSHVDVLIAAQNREDRSQ